VAVPISFKPTFKHVDWVDSIDRVRAGGGNGFNVRFHAIENDLGTIGQVVDAINAQLGGTPVATETTLTLTPTLVTTGSDNSNAWGHGPGFAQKLAGVTSASGMMSVAVPNGVKIVSFRATGVNSNANTSFGLVITLNRFAVANPLLATDQPDPLFTAIVKGGTYDAQIPASPPNDPRFTVDTTNFRYFITAVLDPRGTNAAMTVTVNTFQIVYQ